MLKITWHRDFHQLCQTPKLELFLSVLVGQGRVERLGHNVGEKMVKDGSVMTPWAWPWAGGRVRMEGRV